MSLPLLAELNRRRVFRALVAYGIAAFAVLQIIEPVMHGLHWPEVVLSYVVVALALGFPVVVALAWAFDVKAGRIERTVPAPGQRGARLAALLAGVGFVAAAPGVVWYLWIKPQERRATTTTSDDALRVKLDAVPPASDIRAPPSIAVLPLVNLSRDPEQEYFADGLAEELLNQLAKVPGLHVAGRTSSFSFKGKGEDLRAIGQKLNVKTVLEGSVQRNGDRLRINTQLINAADGYHLWSDSYDRRLTDVFAVQDEIARAVVTALKIQLLPASAAAPATSPQAYNQFLLGRHLCRRGSPEGYQLGEAAFRKAVELDPSYAPAWAMLAKAIFWSADAVGWHAAGRQQDVARALVAADKAVELAPGVADGYVARGFLRSVKIADWAGARSDLARALQLSPGNSEALDVQADLFATLGRIPEAIATARKSSELDPLAPQPLWRLAWFHLAAGQREEARRIASQALELFPESAHCARTLGFALLLMGRLDEAEAAFQRSSIPAFREMGPPLVEYARGREAKSREALAHLIAAYPHDMSYQVAEIYAFRGDPEHAFEWLEHGIAVQDAGMRHIKADPFMRSLHGDPRYQEVLRKLKLPLD